jgi:Rrf2 family protein
MMFSTRGRYALRAMIDIAENNTGEYITLKEIAKRQEISEKYLESILPALTKAGFLDGLRGKGGGYKLARAPESYTVGSVLKLLEGNFTTVACLERDPNKCRRASDCRTLPMWQKFQTMADAFFEEITLADLCNEQHTGGGCLI